MNEDPTSATLAQRFGTALAVVSAAIAAAAGAQAGSENAPQATYDAAQLERELEIYRSELAGVDEKYALIEDRLAASLAEVAALTTRTDRLAQLATPGPPVAESSTGSEAAPTIRRLRTTVNTNLRLEPAVTSERIALVPADTEVVARDSAGDWRRIEGPSGITGWAHSRLLAEVEADSVSDSVEAAQQLVATVRVNVRNGPGLEFERVGRLERGERCWSVGRDGEWLQIDRGDGAVGWIHEDYLEPPG